MSKKKRKDDCCCANSCGDSCLGFPVNECFQPFIFWLIACGAGLINNKSILIILLVLLCGNGCGCGSQECGC
ncbi:MAG: hypothetical protein ACRC7N_13080 [Clostridium sp.]